jgi:hypothetical protein
VEWVNSWKTIRLCRTYLTSIILSSKEAEIFSHQLAVPLVEDCLGHYHWYIQTTSNVYTKHVPMTRKQTQGSQEARKLSRDCRKVTLGKAEGWDDDSTYYR